MQITFSRDLRGKTVLDGAGQIVGSLEDILIDGVSWRVEGVRVRLRREAAKDLGAAAGMFRPATIDVPQAMVRAAGDAIILSVSRAALQELVKAVPTESAGAPPA